MKHCQVEVQESISGYHFQTIGKLANNDFEYHIEVIYSIEQYILTKNVCFFPYVRNFTFIYGPFSCLTNVSLAVI